MHSSPTDLALVIVVIAGALVLGVLLSRAVNRYRSPGPPLRMLTGTRSQQAALRLALAPVLHEFLPMLDRAGQEVRAIVLVPTLSGSNGEPIASEVEQVGGATAFTVRVAHRIGSTVRQPDEVAGSLAEDLLYLYRHAAAVTVIRQTPAPSAPAAPVQSPLAARLVGRNGMSIPSTHAAQKETEETVVNFKPNPLGRNNNQGS